ncbi:hypothetical protein AMTRI_Chr06g175040 [Amborella trichopoda]
MTWYALWVTLGNPITQKEITPLLKFDFNILNFGTQIHSKLQDIGSWRPLPQIQLDKRKRLVCIGSTCYRNGRLCLLPVTRNLSDKIWVLSEERKWVEVKVVKANLRQLRIKNVCAALWIGETLILYNWMRYITCNVKSGKKDKLTTLPYLIIGVFAYQPNLVTGES